MTRLSITAFAAISMLLGCGQERTSSDTSRTYYGAEITAYNPTVAQNDNEPCIASRSVNICELHKAGIATAATGDRSIQLGSVCTIRGRDYLIKDRKNVCFDPRACVDHPGCQEGRGKARCMNAQTQKSFDLFLGDDPKAASTKFTADVTCRSPTNTDDVKIAMAR